ELMPGVFSGIILHDRCPNTLARKSTPFRAGVFFGFLAADSAQKKPAALCCGPRLSKKSQPDDMCVRLGHLQGNLPRRVCEAARPSARFCGKFCPQGDIRGKEFLSRACVQKWVPPKAWRFSPRSARSFVLRAGKGRGGLPERSIKVGS